MNDSIIHTDCLVIGVSAVQTALLVVHGASLNPHSKGCHYIESDVDNSAAGDSLP